MSFEQLLNVKFVEAVESYPCLWDTKSKKYRNKVYVREAWHNISERFKEPGDTCRERWRNIRNAFIRSLKRYPDESIIRRQYYLKDHLQFLLPYVKNLVTLSNGSDNEDNKVSESEEDIKPGAFQVNNVIIPEFHQIDLMEPASTSFQSSGNLILNPSLTRYNGNHRQSDNEFVEQYTSTEELPSKKRKRNDEESEDSDLTFFKSLLRDVRKMTNRQNRKFRSRVLQAVDEILDDEQEEPSRSCEQCKPCNHSVG